MKKKKEENSTMLNEPTSMRVRHSKPSDKLTGPPHGSGPQATKRLSSARLPLGPYPLSQSNHRQGRRAACGARTCGRILVPGSPSHQAPVGMGGKCEDMGSRKVTLLFSVCFLGCGLIRLERYRVHKLSMFGWCLDYFCYADFNIQ